MMRNLLGLNFIEETVRVLSHYFSLPAIVVGFLSFALPLNFFVNTILPVSLKTTSRMTDFSPILHIDLLDANDESCCC